MIRHIQLRAVLFAFALFLGIANAVTSPACNLAAAPPQKNLTNVRTAYTSVPGSPLGIVYASQPGIAFVALMGANATLGVLNTTTFPPTLIAQNNLPSTYRAATSLALSHDGAFVFVSSGPGAVVFNTTRAIAGSSDAVVGTLNGTTASQNPGTGAFSVALSNDDKYAFIAQEDGPGYAAGQATPGNIDVFKLQTSKGQVSGTPIGFSSLGYLVIGPTLSPNGRLAYATSEQTSVTNRTGFISTLDVKTLETNPTQAVLTNATAGCSPVRVIVSSDGKTVWVTARESNYLLAFNATKLRSDPANALIAAVQVGTSPVGLVFARNETRIITADGNRFHYANATSGLSVVDVKAALSGSSSAVLGRIPAGLFPRDVDLTHDGKTILVTDYDSRQIQAVDVSSLP